MDKISIEMANKVAIISINADDNHAFAKIKNRSNTSFATLQKQKPDLD
ncbi:MAG: hypothetical protein ACOVSR_02075 [Bacteroidia bacterium]